MNTTHYGLYVTDDSTERFQNVRRAVYGTEDSNMTKIDNILFAKADNSYVVYATLKAGAWSGATAPYQQSIAVKNMGKDQNGVICVSSTATIEQREAARNAALFIVKQEENLLTIAADGVLPTVDIPVMVTLLG